MQYGCFIFILSKHKTSGACSVPVCVKISWECIRDELKWDINLCEGVWTRECYGELCWHVYISVMNEYDSADSEYVPHVHMWVFLKIFTRCCDSFIRSRVTPIAFSLIVHSLSADEDVSIAWYNISCTGVSIGNVQWIILATDMFIISSQLIQECSVPNILEPSLFHPTNDLWSGTRISLGQVRDSLDIFNHAT